MWYKFYRITQAVEHVNTRKHSVELMHSVVPYGTLHRCAASVRCTWFSLVGLSEQSPVQIFLMCGIVSLLDYYQIPGIFYFEKRQL